MDNNNDIVFNILEILSNQKLFFNGEIGDGELIDFVKRPSVVAAVQSFAKQMRDEWDSFKGEEMKLNSVQTCDENPEIDNNDNVKTIEPMAENKETGTTEGTADCKDVSKSDNVAEKTATCESDQKDIKPISEIINTVETPLITVAKEPNITPKAPPIIVDKPIRFQLPNARKGEKYEASISTKEDGQFEIRDIKSLEDIGLSFDSQRRLISGTPQKYGEFKINLWYRTDTNVTRSGEIVLIVNPNPRELWDNKEPDQTLPYRKKHTETQIKRLENDFCIAAASRRGRSHAHSGSFRDDDFYIDYDDEGWSVLIAADGAGSAKLSRVGSKTASDAVGGSIMSSLKEEGGLLLDLIKKWDNEAQKDISKKIYLLFQKAAKNAVEAINTIAQSEKVLPRDMATTLLAAISKKVDDKLFTASFWVGDGAIAVYSPNGEIKVRVLGSPDGGEYAGQTRFLDSLILRDGEFDKRIRVDLRADVKAIFLMTDGVSDPIFETDNGLNEPKKWDDLWSQISPFLSSEDPSEKLLEWLEFWSPGNHDDRTIVIQFFGER
ncbi:MAG: protein phosphatase 2C domain-containing protein [Campylobacteraceae bacterium]|jgi:hypothetical protein|nr:protein phosphatase 2C domain-containing protein [Campylobacteraceae bacterium]